MIDLTIIIPNCSKTKIFKIRLQKVGKNLDQHYQGKSKRFYCSSSSKTLMQTFMDYFYSFCLWFNFITHFVVAYSWEVRFRVISHIGKMTTMCVQQNQSVLNEKWSFEEMNACVHYFCSYTIQEKHFLILLNNRDREEWLVTPSKHYKITTTIENSNVVFCKV